jgi:hypothetical protein
MNADRPGPKSARAWKAYYARERDELGDVGMRALFDRAPRIALPTEGALVFPHTKARVSGHLVAAVARAVIDARCDEVVALGVLHGARERDAELVKKARAGDATALAALRRVHDERSPYVEEEFSLDGFRALLDVAASIAGRSAPRVHARFPFLVGETPHDLPGLDDLRSLRARGCVVVATTDPIHHGVGYGNDVESAQPIASTKTIGFACACIDAQLDALSKRDFTAFQRAVVDARSDFRDVGPVLAMLLDEANGSMRDLVLVDYADALSTPSPTWVAAPLIAFALPHSTVSMRAD